MAYLYKLVRKYGKLGFAMFVSTVSYAAYGIAKKKRVVVYHAVF